LLLEIDASIETPALGAAGCHFHTTFRDGARGLLCKINARRKLPVLRGTHYRIRSDSFLAAFPQKLSRVFLVTLRPISAALGYRPTHVRSLRLTSLKGTSSSPRLPSLSLPRLPRPSRHQSRIDLFLFLYRYLLPRATCTID